MNQEAAPPANNDSQKDSQPPVIIAVPPAAPSASVTTSVPPSEVTTTSTDKVSARVVTPAEMQEIQAGCKNDAFYGGYNPRQPDGSFDEYVGKCVAQKVATLQKSTAVENASEGPKAP